MSIINSIQNCDYEDYNIDDTKPAVGYVLGEDDGTDEDCRGCC